MKEGILRLYHTIVDENDNFHKMLMAKFVFYGNRIVVLEDHSGIMDDLVPQGKVTDQILNRLERLNDSPYWAIISEQDIREGNHDNLIPEKLD